MVAVRGELDLTNAELLQRAIAPMAGSATPLLVFDLKDLAFMDSSGLAVLLTAASAGGTVGLRNPSPAIRDLIAATGLGDVLPVVP